MATLCVEVQHERERPREGGGAAINHQQGGTTAYPEATNKCYFDGKIKRSKPILRWFAQAFIASVVVFSYFFVFSAIHHGLVPKETVRYTSEENASSIRDGASPLVTVADKKPWHVRLSNMYDPNPAFLLNFSTNGTILEGIPFAAFSPYDFVNQNTQWLGLWEYNYQIAESAYMEFIPNNRTIISSSAQDEVFASSISTYVYIHLHKGGGTSMSLASYPKFFKASTLYSTYRRRHKRAFERRVHEWFHPRVLGNGSEYAPFLGGSDSIMFFSFIRDPADKFLSGVGQVLEGYPNRKWDRRWERNISPCAETFLGKNSSDNISEDSINRLLHCVVDKMNFTLDIDPVEHKVQKRKMTLNDQLIQQIDYLDVHLLPQVLELYNGVDKKPYIPVVLMDLTHMNTWFEASRAIPPQGNARSKTNSEVGEKEDKVNSSRRLRGFKLPKLSPTEIYRSDPHLLQKVCELYKMDVDLLKLLKIGGVHVSTKCTVE